MSKKLDMGIFDPITPDNLYTLRPGEWIWDNKRTCRQAHKRTLGNEVVQEPIGFRQIHILDLKLYPRFSSTPFMLSNIDKSRSEWVYYEIGRFYKFKNSDLSEVE